MFYIRALIQKINIKFYTMFFTEYQRQALHGLMLRRWSYTKKNENNPIYTQTFGQFGELFAKHIFAIFNNFCTPKGLYSYKVQSGKNSPFYQRFIVRTRSLPILEEAFLFIFTILSTF